MTVTPQHTERFAVGEQGRYLITVTNTGPTAKAAGRTITCNAPSVTNTATATAPGAPPASASDTAPVQVPPRPQGGGVAYTGVDSGELLLYALSLIALGILALLAARRRRTRP